jgi:Ca2+/Na+ antiporter
MLGLLPQFIVFIAASLALWWGTGLVVSAISSIAKTLHISAFTLSFFVLGILTSLPEATIGITALYRDEAAFMVGNLIGKQLMIIVNYLIVLM